MCEGIWGELGDLIIDENHIANVEGIPIDLLIEALIDQDAANKQNGDDNDDVVAI